MLIKWLHPNDHLAIGPTLHGTTGSGDTAGASFSRPHQRQAFNGELKLINTGSNKV